MAIREPKIIEMYADGKEYGTLTREEIMEHFPEMRADEMTDGWGTACEYLSKYTDSDGLCRLDLERLVADGSDCTRDAAVSVIISTLLNVNRAENIPEEILERAVPYFSARMAQLEYFNMKLKKLQTFAVQAVGILSSAMESDDMMEYLFVPILMKSIRISDELAASALLRGFEHTGNQTILYPLKMKLCDYFTGIISVAIVAVLFYLQYNYGGN